MTQYLQQGKKLQYSFTSLRTTTHDYSYFVKYFQCVMAASCEIDDTNKETTYIFRFGTTDKVIHLTEEQLDFIPYLSLLVIHKNDFSSIENENGEYVLSSRIRYNWFIPILKSITTGHPSALFTELSRESYVCGMLQLYDYLCINPISVPLLKDQNLVRTKSDNIDDKKVRVKYSLAKNLLEVRDTAVEFIVSLSKNEYDLNDSNTLHNVYSLIMVIFSNPNIFGSQLCHHTWIVVKKCGFSLFSVGEQCNLDNAQQTIYSNKADSSTCLSNNDEPLPNSFENAFAWKGYYAPIEENNTDLLSKYPMSMVFGNAGAGKSSFIRHLLDDYIEQKNLLMYRYENIESMYRSSMDAFRERHSIVLIDTPGLEINHDKEFHMCEFKQEQWKNEAKSARSGRFNTLPKRPKIDKFKHRCGPKVQKYR
jgi:hypothetical protein